MLSTRLELLQSELEAEVFTLVAGARLLVIGWIMALLAGITAVHWIGATFEGALRSWLLALLALVFAGVAGWAFRLRRANTAHLLRPLCHLAEELRHDAATLETDQDPPTRPGQ